MSQEMHFPINFDTLTKILFSKKSTVDALPFASYILKGIGYQTEETILTISHCKMSGVDFPNQYKTRYPRIFQRNEPENETEQNKTIRMEHSSNAGK
jgi:hypothetical protein